MVEFNYQIKQTAVSDNDKYKNNIYLLGGRVYEA